MGLLLKSLVLAVTASCSCMAFHDFDSEMNMEIERARDSLAVRMLSGDNQLFPIPETIKRLDLTALDHLLQISGLDKTLEGKGPFTVFGPMDVAFRKLPDWAKKAVSNKTVLTDLLRFHVLPREVKAEDLKDNELQLTAQGKSLRINIYSRVPENRKVVTAQCAPLEILRANKPATNGLIHVLERVMIPPAGNLVVSLAACPKFKTLVHLLKITGLTRYLSGAGPFTVFAPNDDAFAKVPKDILAKLMKNKKLLTKVLTYHVLPSSLCSAGISRGPVKTLEGEPVYLSYSEAGVKVNTAKVVYPDSSVTNGVVHAIDTLLLPQSLQLN